MRCTSPDPPRARPASVRRRSGRTIRGGVLLVALLAPGAAGAADIPLAGVIPGGGVVYKRVESVTESRFTNIVRQETDYSCGAASVATILKYGYGRGDVTEEEILVAMMKVSDPDEIEARGFSLLEIKKYAESIGLKGVGLKVEPKDLTKLQMPTITLIDVRGYKHFVVLKTVRDGWAFIADPALGNLALPVDEFAVGWNGIVFAMVGPGFNPESPLAAPKEPATARSFIKEFGERTDLRTLDYGTLGQGLFKP